MLLRLINIVVLMFLFCSTSFSNKIIPDKKVAYSSTPNRDLYLHVFYPYGQMTGSNRTAIIHFFGGGWCTGNAGQFYPQCHYLASKGYVAISVDYRIKKTDGVTPFDCVEDARKAIRYIRANADEFGIDPNKIIASGGSAGGHVALCTAVFKRKDSNPISAIPNGLILYNPVLDTTKDGYGINMFTGNELLLSPNHNICAGLPPTLVFHGTKDRTVPYKNALKFAALMESFGNSCKLVSFEDADHGFFNLNKKNGDEAFNRCMNEVILFMHENGFSPKKKLSSSQYHLIRDSLKISLSKFSKGGKAKVAFIGGSITQGKGWRDSICIYLQKKYPKTQFDFINAGISAQGAMSATFRVERDVLSKGNIDLIFIETSVNDRMPALKCYTPDRVRSMEGLIRHIWAKNKKTDIVLLHFADQFKIADYAMGNIPQEIKDYESIADYYHISSIHLAKEITDRIANKEFTWDNDFRDIHPSPFGQSLYTASIEQFLDKVCCLENDMVESDFDAGHFLPDKLDSLCYDSGNFVSCKNVKKTDGFSFRPLKDGNKQLFFQSDQVGDSFCLEFEGNAIGMLVFSGPDAGMIEYSIDGGPFKPYDLYTVNSWMYYVPRYYILCDGLSSRKTHSLVVRIVKQKNGYSLGNRCIIKEFFVNK